MATRLVNVKDVKVVRQVAVGLVRQKKGQHKKENTEKTRKWQPPKSKYGNNCRKRKTLELR